MNSRSLISKGNCPSNGENSESAACFLLFYTQTIYFGRGGERRRLVGNEVKNERKEIWQWFSTGAPGRPPETCPIPPFPELVVSFVLCLQQGLGGAEMLQLLVDNRQPFE